MRLVCSLLFVAALLATKSLCGYAEDKAWIELNADSKMQSWQEDGRDWEIAGDAILDEKNTKNLIAQPGSGVLVNLLHEKSEHSNLTSKQTFGDAEVHVEFKIPQGSNAGVKFQGLYEIQIRDTHGIENPSANDCGGIYPRAEEKPRYHLIDEGISPRTNAAKPAGEWQTLDALFRAPRFDSQGNKTENARLIKVVLNGQLIHEDVELQWPTGHAWDEKPEVAKGPLFLQGDHGPIAYRNVRVRPIAEETSEVTITPDVVYGHKFGMALTYDVFHPAVEANGAGVLFMVSGGWFSNWGPPENLRGLFKPLTDKGFTVFAVRHGSSPKYSIPEIVKDVRRSVRFIRMRSKDYGIDPERLGVFGMSAGGHLSLVLGTTADEGDPEAKDPVLHHSNRVAAVVSLVPPTDLTIMVWEAPDHLPAYDRFPALDLDMEAAKEFSPLMHVTPDDAPSLVISGAKDKLVPVKHSEDINAAFDKIGVENELIVFENSGHGFIEEDRPKAFTAMADWFEKHLTDTEEIEQ